MREYEYASALAPDIRAYVAFKASVGVTGSSMRWHLFDFDRWCAAKGFSSLTKEAVESYVLDRLSRTDPSQTTWASYLREFGRWMRVNGKPDAYVLSGDFKTTAARKVPYLLSDEEVDAFFDAAARLDVRSPMSWEARCLFGLMHSCGLRTCEARRLRVEDVDLDGMRIDIMWSKGHRSRRLAITGEVAEMLERCGSMTDAAVGADRPAFFATSTGNVVGGAAVGTVFGRIWLDAGLPESKGGKRPRPYDLRHRFAYANIERWQREGRDVMAMLPYLARYMGHSSYESTYYYVHTSPDFMAAYADIVSPRDALLPEVGFDG